MCPVWRWPVCKNGMSEQQLVPFLSSMCQWQWSATNRQHHPERTKAIGLGKTWPASPMTAGSSGSSCSQLTWHPTACSTRPAAIESAAASKSEVWLGAEHQVEAVSQASLKVVLRTAWMVAHLSTFHDTAFPGGFDGNLPYLEFLCRGPGPNMCIEKQPRHCKRFEDPYLGICGHGLLGIEWSAKRTPAGFGIGTSVFHLLKVSGPLLEPRA